MGLPGKPILGDYFQENMTSQRPFLLLRISFPGGPIFIQLPPEGTSTMPRTTASSSGKRHVGMVEDSDKLCDKYPSFISINYDYNFGRSAARLFLPGLAG